MKPGRALGGSLAVLAALFPGTAFAGAPVRLGVSFDRGAWLGGSTALRTSLSVDLKAKSSPMTGMRLYLPASLGLTTSGLGQASCRLPVSDFSEVLLPDSLSVGLAGCPPNAVLGLGTADAQVVLGDGQKVFEAANLTLLAGPVASKGLGVVIFLDGEHPLGGRYLLAGQVVPVQGRFGGALEVSFQQAPALRSLLDAVVAIDSMRINLGSAQITYYEHHGHRRVAYHPGGIALPDRCPRGGFPFRAELTFKDGSQSNADATVSCSDLAHGRP